MVVPQQIVGDNVLWDVSRELELFCKIFTDQNIMLVHLYIISLTCH